MSTNPEEPQIEIINRPPAQPMIVLIPTRSGKVSFGLNNYHSEYLLRGEARGFTEEQAEFLLKKRLAVRPGESLDPPKPDETPTRIRIVVGTQIGFAFYGLGERTTAPAHVATRLITAKAAILDDGAPDPIRPVSTVRNAVRRRVAAILELYR
jgi:hypothetical protein